MVLLIDDAIFVLAFIGPRVRAGWEGFNRPNQENDFLFPFSRLLRLPAAHLQDGKRKCY